MRFQVTIHDKSGATAYFRETLPDALKLFSAFAGDDHEYYTTGETDPNWEMVTITDVEDQVELVTYRFRQPKPQE